MTTAAGSSPGVARRTKLVATIGPASVGLVGELVAAGLDVARINLSHGSAEEHHRSADAVRAAAIAAGRTVAILVDLPGPKLRLGELGPGPIELTPGAVFTLTGPSGQATPSALPLGDAAVLRRLQRGDRILLADGAVELRVVGDDDITTTVEVVRGGTVRTRQGVSVPAERLAADVLGAADESHIGHLLELRPDFVGQSFVRSADDVQKLRSRLPPDVRIVAKIETRPAVEDIADILEVADAIMVARGDLGVELPFEQVPMVQKQLVRAALAAGRPSIVATQMLESMIDASAPTRAEASDVANAVLDGADAVMLSGETAVGRWPVEALQAAASISAVADDYDLPTRPPDVTAAFEHHPDARAVAQAAVALADADEDVVGVACFTRSGRTARLLSALRPRVPVVAFTPQAAIARALTLHRGIRPVVLDVDAADPGAVSVAVNAALAAGASEWELTASDAVVLVQTSVDGGPNTIDVLRP